MSDDAAPAPVTARGLLAAAATVWKVALGPVLSTAAALTFLLACDLLLFRTALIEGQIYFRSDTTTYYYPIADRLVDALREGNLLLWTRHLFGGFPLFADGEAGMLYPPNLLAYLLLPDQEAFVWLRVARYFMAATFTYAYLRSLRLNGFAATIGGLSFGFGSFMVTQMHHTNVGNTALWLPLALFGVEMAVQSVGRHRWLWATGAGAAVGVQALGVHIQPLLMTGLFLAVYIPFRVLLCPIAWPAAREKPRPAPLDPPRLAAAVYALFLAAPSRELPRGRPSPVVRCATLLLALLSPVARLGLNTLHRVILAALLLGIVPATALGIAAVQLLPLAELGLFSFRGSGVPLEFATSYSMPVQNLINLIFPYFFRYTNHFYWSLWSEWETTLYLGIPPLVLASIALLFVRRRMVLLFAVAAVAGTLLAFGGYSPYPLYEELRQLPGFSSLRVPGRFSMLVTFCGAVLAAMGADWLCRTLRPHGARSGEGWWSRFSRAVGTHGFALYLAALLVALAGALWWLTSWRLWIEREPWLAGRLVEESYLSLRTTKPWLTSDMVLSFLRFSLDPTSEKTTISLALALATVLLLFGWFAFRRLWRVWASLLVALVAADMLLFAMDFHPTMSVRQLSTPNAATRWLMSQQQTGRERVYTSWEVRKTEANKLLPFRVSEIGGYSSLETTRHRDYLANLAENEKALLDLYGARYLVLSKRFPALPSYEYTAYHPNRPLANGPRGNRGAHVNFYMAPPVKADEVAFISNLREATHIAQDAEVADIVVVDTAGERVTLRVRAGRDTAEWAFDRPDVTPHMRHRRAEVADRVWVEDPDGRRYQANLYYAKLKLDKTRTVSRVEFHYLQPLGKVRLYGMMLWENPRTAHQVLGRDKFIPRYEDDEVVILENPSRLPKAWMVPAARLLDETQIVDTMVHGDFDPEKVVLLESGSSPRSLPLPDLSNLPLSIPLPDMGDLPGSIPLPDTGLGDPSVEAWLRSNSDAGPGAVEIVDYRSTEVVLRTQSDRNAALVLSDSYYPGWKATVDGSRAKVYRADYLFRAVLVPRGRHEVRFLFEPESFALGREISTFTLSTLLILWALLLPGVLLYRGTRKAVGWIWRRTRFRSHRAAPPAGD